MGFKFLKTSRLLKKSQYDPVFANAKAIPGKNWLFLCIKNDVSCARLGLIVAKKKLPRANWRNFAKRMVRETFRHQHEKLPAVDIVVLLRKPLEKKDSKQVSAELNQQWEKLIKTFADC